MGGGGVTLRMLDLFSGIGGFTLAARMVGGIETVQFVEREAYCRRILEKHWPTVPIHDDICTFQPERGSADIVCGGFPCQDISTAGKQAGIKEGTRSGLFYELMRVVRMVGPRYVVLENVAAITSNGLDVVLGALAEAGFDAEWACIPAADVGACHRRDRWWCVAYANDQRWNRSKERNQQQEAWLEAPQRDKSHRLGMDAPHPQSRRRGAGQGQGTGQAGHQGQGAGDGGEGSDTADANHARLEGRVSTGMCERSRQRLAWPGNTQSLSPDWRKYLSEPVLCRGDDGLSGRVDRLKALGNAVVPQVAAIPLARVLERESYRRHC